MLWWFLLLHPMMSQVLFNFYRNFMQVYWKTNARKMYIIMQMSILGQNFIQIQSDKEHTHIHSHILNHKKASSIISTTKSISLRQTLLRPTTHSTSLPSFDLWSNVEFLVLKPSSRHFSFFLFLSPFPFYRPSSDGILMILIIAFLIHHFNFFLAEKKKSEQRQQKMANRRMTMHKILICFRLNAFSL